MKYETMKKILFIAAGMFVFADAALGHGFGQTLTKIVGDNEINLDIAAYTIIAGEAVRLDFDISKRGALFEKREFTDIWVRIEPEDKRGVVFAGSLANAELGAGMTYAFPRLGNYTLSARFEKSGVTVAEEVSFPLVVEPSANEAAQTPWRNMLASGLIAFALGAVAALLFKKKFS